MRVPSIALILTFCSYAQQSPLPILRMADGKQWTARNLTIPIPDSYCYADSPANCGVYGRLYQREAARRVCRTLGEGWHLPSDAEWRRMAKQYGGVSEDSADQGKSAYRALLSGGPSGFAAVLGGGRGQDGQYARLDAHGFYWSDSEDGRGTAVYYNFGKGGLALHRQSEGETQRAFSVRCVKD